jgi:hypothetical protein
MQKIIQYFAENPKRIFMADSLGAAMTTFFIFGIMRPLHEYFGLPKAELTYLSLIAFGFFVYSAACFLLVKARWRGFLRLIALANLSYCGLTLALMIKYNNLSTSLGLIYFSAEILLIVSLSYIELSVSRTKN